MKKFTCLFISICFINLMYAQHTLVVQADKPGAAIQPTMWGVFFEDINFGADGGIYAELVKNRSFEFYRPLMGWETLPSNFSSDTMQVINRAAENKANPRFLRVKIMNKKKGELGLVNEGFRGMGIKQDLRYDFSLMYRKPVGNITLHVELIDTSNNVVGDTMMQLAATDTMWHKQGVSFHSHATVPDGKLRTWFAGNGVVDVDMISLFPGDTWKNRPGGMRADMVQKLADMKPGFIRFPGGCIVEGFDLANRYRWKNTVGPLENRQLIINRWNTEFSYRAAPDYYQTFGLGFFEYFQLAEDIGAEPLPLINCGMACQFNSAEVVPISDLDPYVQDALDLIEFANGDTTTNWGKLRANMGHAAPFNMKMLGIGNEQWGPQYVERNKIFTAAIKAKYPNIKLVNSAGPFSSGEMFSYLNDTLRSLHADIIDEHYYMPPEWFLKNAKRYDNYPRNETKIFAGEYAAHTKLTDTAIKKNNWQSALAEAAFMTGLERNADVVSMASYAPLFANADAWQWAPDLIWVNNMKSYGTPSYYIQQLYSLNKGTNVVPITLNNAVVAGTDSLYANACIDKNTNELIIKIANTSPQPQTETINLGGKKFAAQAKLSTMQAALAAVNSFAQPTNVVPQETTIDINNKKIILNAAPYSFSVIRIKM